MTAFNSTTAMIATPSINSPSAAETSAAPTFFSRTPSPQGTSPVRPPGVRLSLLGRLSHAFVELGQSLVVLGDPFVLLGDTVAVVR